MTERDEDETRRIMTEWMDHLTARLDIGEAPVDIDEILAIAGIAAHAVLRPAAPLTTYLLGYVAGRAAQHTGGAVQGETVRNAAVRNAAADIRAAAAERGSSPSE
jgi:Domain of unknown function (DUF6457)